MIDYEEETKLDAAYEAMGGEASMLKEENARLKSELEAAREIKQACPPPPTAPVRKKTGGKAKQIARQLAQVQRGYAHLQQEHKRLLAHCREIEATLQEHVNNSNATLTVNDDDYYDQLNGESVVVSTTNGELRVWIDEGQHIRVHGELHGERMTCEELNDVLAALVAARWHQEDAVEDVEVAA